LSRFTGVSDLSEAKDLFDEQIMVGTGRFELEAFSAASEPRAEIPSAARERKRNLRGA